MWNGYLKRVRNSGIKRLETNKSHSILINGDDINKIWLDLPYNGKLEEKSLTSLLKKLTRYLKRMLTSLLSIEQTNYLCFVQLRMK